LEHHGGYLQQIIFKDGTTSSITAIYANSPFEQHCNIPETLGCELTDQGYIRIDSLQKTTVHGIFACGDNSSRMRTLSNAVSTGTIAGMMANKEIIEEEF
jgi:thioredoxin reductase